MSKNINIWKQQAKKLADDMNIEELKGGISELEVSINEETDSNQCQKLLLALIVFKNEHMRRTRT